MQLSVTVDDREPAGVVRALRDHSDVAEVTVERLDAGDVVAGAVGVERKTPTDFVRSAMGARGTDLRDQLRRLTAAYDRAYLLVESDLASLATESGAAPASVNGVVASTMARTGVPVLPCGDRERLVDVAVRLVRKHVEEPGSRPLPPGSTPGRTVPVAKRMYGCIDGIGPETAATLHEAYPTVAALAEATPAALERLDGIGEHRAQAIYEAFHGPE